jgi:hypothetical protein
MHDRRVDELVSVVVARLSDHLPHLVEDMVDAVQREVPVFRRPGIDLVDFQRSLRRIVGLFVRVVEERRELHSDELVAVHVIGAQRARQGLPPDAVVDSIRVALRVAWETVLELVAQEEAAVLGLHAVGRLSLLHMAFTHEVLDAIETAYATEREQRLSGQVQAQATFVDRVLDGYWDNEGEIRSGGAALGNDLGKLCGLLMLLPAGGQDAESLRAAASKMAGRVPGAFEGPMRTLPTLHVVLLLAVGSMPAWPEALEAVKDLATGERLIVVPAEPTAQVNKLTHVYRRAQPYLTLAHAVGSGAGIVTVKELRLYAVLAGIPLSDRIEFVRDMLGPVLDLPEHKANELLDTLDAVYRRRGRIADAARALHLHQNSVRYRLNRIEQLTGLCLDVPAERLHLELAMRLRWVAKAELATLDDVPKGRVRTRPA